MTNKLIQELESVLPVGVHIPLPIRRLYEWITNKHLYKEVEDVTHGFLYPEKELRESWTDDFRKGGTIVEFVASGNLNLEFWLDKDSEEANSRLCVFGRTGADGSECALWLTDNGETKIVHLGSGSGSTLICILADNAIDFLRLLAIGYDEICWSEEFAFAPNTVDQDFFVEPNVEFQQWVIDTFGVTIPLLYPTKKGGIKTGRSDLWSSYTSQPVPPREATPQSQTYDPFTTGADCAPLISPKVYCSVCYRTHQEPQRAVWRSSPAPQRPR